MRDNNIIQEAIDSLKRLRKENAELKAELQKYKDIEAKGLEEFKDVGGCWGCGLQLQLNQDLEDIKQLKAENERLREENYQLQKDCQICENFIDFIPCKPIRDMDYDLQKVINQRDKYIQTLQEIKEIADARCNECKYGKDGISCKYGDCGEAKLHLITQLITKAEREE